MSRSVRTSEWVCYGALALALVGLVVGAARNGMKLRSQQEADTAAEAERVHDDTPASKDESFDVDVRLCGIAAVAHYCRRGPYQDYIGCRQRALDLGIDKHGVIRRETVKWKEGAYIWKDKDGPCPQNQ